MNFNRTEDQAGVFGSILFHALLLFLVAIAMMYDGCSEELEDPLDGAVAVSLGEPDFGGPDASTAMAEPTPTEPQDQVDEQVTSDIEDAPEVQTTPTPTPTPRPTPTPTPTPQTEPERTVDRRGLFSSSGGGSGDGTQSGDQGQKDGSETGKPDGSGTSGTQGTGFEGDGFSGNINGFRVVAGYKPENNQQEFGKVTVIVCVDKNGKVVEVRPGGTPTTNTSKHLENLSIQAAWKFTFQRIGDATNKNCGYITFNYRAG